MRAMADDRGFTLVELLVAMLMTTVVMAAVVLLFTSFIDNNRLDNFREDAQYNAQTMVDRMSREIRNAAAPSTGASTIQKAGSYDILFQEVSATGTGSTANASNDMWVRYCLDSNSTLWRQTTPTSSTTTSLPDTSACPSTNSAWVTTSSGSPCCQQLNDITNEVGGDTTRPVFTYGPSGYPSTSQITSVQVALYVDRNTGNLPGTTALTSGIYLRNALQAPTANFTNSQQVNSSTSTTVQLNGSFSTDPNGQALSYQWYNALNCPSANAVSGATSQQYSPTGTFNPNTTPTQPFSLQVTDTAGLTNCTSQTVTIQ